MRRASRPRASWWLTEENISLLKPGVTRAEEVRDLLGPPFEPMQQALSGNGIWTYPMRIAGHPTPGVPTETYLIDDPNWVPRDGARRFP